MTNFEHYWKIIQRKMPGLLLISLAAALVAFLVVRQIGPTHEVHFSYLVSMNVRDDAPEFRFDGYYALQATDLFAATLAKWTAAPEVVVAAHQAVGLVLKSQDPRQFSRLIQAEKTAPQLVQITVRDASLPRTERLAQGLQTVMEQNVTRYHDQATPAIGFQVVATEAWAGMTQPSLPVIVSATFIFTFLIAMNVLLLLESLKLASK